MHIKKAGEEDHVGTQDGHDLILGHIPVLGQELPLDRVGRDKLVLQCDEPRLAFLGYLKNHVYKKPVG